MKEETKNVTTKSKKIRNIVLSAVAVAELLLLLMSMTFSWFEGISSLEMLGSNIKTAGALNSHIILGENKSTDDDTFDDIINLADFYDPQREVRLSPVSSSDAKTFYAAYIGTPGSTTDALYRILAPEDINANIIRFQFNISCDDGPTDVYLAETLPKIIINGEEKTEASEAFRIAFDDGTYTRIICPSASDDASRDYSELISIKSIDNKNIPTTTTGTVESPLDYYYSSNHQYTKALFHLEKGEVKTITCSIWLEAFDESCSNVTSMAGKNISFDIKMCTSWSISREITVYDYTAKQWITDKNSEGETTTLYVRNIDGDYGTKKDEHGKDVNYDNRRLYEFTYNADNHTWTGKIPIALDNCQFVWKKAGKTYNLWDATGRNGNTILYIFGAETTPANEEVTKTSRACMWQKNEDEKLEVIKIYFSDYTESIWVNKLQAGETNLNLTAEIVADNRIMEYSMTSSEDDVLEDDNKRPTWSCFIPSTVETVTFKRSCNKSGTYSTTDHWVGINRIIIDEKTGKTVYNTIYQATDEDADGSSNTEVNPAYFLYVSINDEYANKFYQGKEEPVISFTHADNTSAENYNPSKDTWPTDGVALEKVPGHNNLYYIAFTERPSGTTEITLWNRSNITKETSIPNDVVYASINFNWTTGNQIYFMSVTDTATGPIIKLNQSVDEVTILGVNSGKQQSGRWDMVSLQGFRTYFVPKEPTESVTVSFIYGNMSYTYSMNFSKDDGIWYTDRIPDTVRNVRYFEDSSGTKYAHKDTKYLNPRTKETPYFYVTGENDNKGTFYSQYPPEGSRVNFRTDDTTITTVTASFKYQENVNGAIYNIPFTINMEKGADDFTWTTTKIPDGVTDITFTATSSAARSTTGVTTSWHTTSGREAAAESTYFALNATKAYWAKPVYLVPDIWKIGKEYFIAHTWEEQSLGAIDTKFQLVPDSSFEYVAYVPKNTTELVFGRIDKSISLDQINWNLTDDNRHVWNKTENKTIPTDSNRFTITDWGNGTWHQKIYLKPNIWNADGAWYAAYFFNSKTNTNQWVKLTASGNSGYYEAVIPGGYTHVTFYRMDKNKTALNEGSAWNQTGKLRLLSDSKNFDITDWGNGTWYQTMYFKPSENWKQDSAWFAAYVFDSSIDSVKWIKLSETDTAGKFMVNIPCGYQKIIFCRMNPESNTMSWDEKYKWSQTEDLTIPSTSSTYTPFKDFVYLEPNSNWKQANAWFAAYFFIDGTNTNSWVKMTDPDGDGIYEAEIPSGSWTHVIFCRMKKTDTSTLSWDNLWNQTNNLQIDSTVNMHTIADGAWSYDNGTWSVHGYWSTN